MAILKKIISLLARLGISVLLLGYILRNVNLKTILEIVGSAHKPLLVAAFLVFGLSYVFCLLRWQMFLKASGIRLPLSRVIISFAGGTFFNLFLPSTIGGDFLRSVDLAAHTKKSSEVVATVILDRLSGYVGLVLVSLSALILGGNISRDKSVLSAVSLVTLILLVILLVLFNKFFYSRINRFLSLPNAGRLRQLLKDIHTQMHSLRSYKQVILNNIAMSIMVQLVLPLSFYIISLSLGLKVGPVYYIVFIPIVGAITMLPISIGGLGVRDASTIFFLAKAGVGNDLALAMSLISFFFILIYAAAGGLIYVLTVSHRRL